MYQGDLMKKHILVIFLCVFSALALADTQNRLTLSSLEKQGFVLMNGTQASEMLIGKTVQINDLLSQAVYEVKISKNGSMKRKIIKDKSPNMLTNIEYSSRADLLSDTVDMSIEGSKIIVTDGVRTYISILYKKADVIYGIRDIDHDVVNFKIILNH